MSLIHTLGKMITDSATLAHVLRVRVQNLAALCSNVTSLSNYLPPIVTRTNVIKILVSGPQQGHKRVIL